MPSMDLSCRQKSFPGVSGKNRKTGTEVQVALRAVALSSMPPFDKL